MTELLSHNFQQLIKPAYLDVVTGCVHKHSTVIPRARLDTVGLSDGTQALQLAVTNEDSVLGEQCHCGHVARPHNIAALGNTCCPQDPA